MNGKTFEGGVAATSLSSRPARSTASRRSAIHLWYKSMSTSVPTSTVSMNLWLPTTTFSANLFCKIFLKEVL